MQIIIVISLNTTLFQCFCPSSLFSFSSSSPSFMRKANQGSGLPSFPGGGHWWRRWNGETRTRAMTTIIFSSDWQSVRLLSWAGPHSLSPSLAESTCHSRKALAATITMLPKYPGCLPFSVTGLFCAAAHPLRPLLSAPSSLRLDNSTDKSPTQRCWTGWESLLHSFWPV